MWKIILQNIFGQNNFGPNRPSLDKKKHNEVQMMTEYLFLPEIPLSSSWHFLIHNTDNTGIVGDQMFYLMAARTSRVFIKLVYSTQICASVL